MFHAMHEATAADWAVIAAATNERTEDPLPERVLSHLQLLGDEKGGFAVSRLTHSLQTATRAARAGRNDEYVLCALLHDIGDTIGQYDHGLLAGAVVKPFVAPELRWMVENHADFQGYFFYQFIGADKDRRERFRGHPNFDLTAEFCAEFDERAFDPTYPTEPIEYFVPLVHDLMAKPRYGSAVSGGVFIEATPD